MSQHKPYHRGPECEMMEVSKTTGEDASRHTLPQHSTNYLKNKNKMGGSYSDIALGFLVITIPMLLLVCALLILVFHHQVQSKGTLFENSEQPQHEKGVYYVNISSTILVFIVS